MTKRIVLAFLLWPAFLAAQGMRISGVTSAQFVELRPLLIDSAGVQSSGALVHAAPFIQDLTLTGWGLGEGLSVHANARVLTQLAGDGLVYPGANDHLQLLDAYAELARSSWRARLGRQWVGGGLGAYDFDGASGLIRRGEFSAEGWGGRALLAGIFEPHTSAELAAVDDRPPAEDGYIFGGRMRARMGAVTSASLTYQRVVVADHSGVYSERAAFDASTRAYGATMDLAAAYDFATGDWNEARLRVGTAGFGSVGLSAEVRHEQPFFELWTIWGAFAPVGFNEVRSTMDWRPVHSPVSLSVHGGYRKYAESNATEINLRTNGWRAGADLSVPGNGTFSGSASYDIDIGFGASRSDVRADVRWATSDDISLGVDGSALQNIYEFRVGTGRVFGVALDGRARLTSDVRLVFDAGLYRNVLTNGATGPDWTQRRASARLEWTVGRDPGAGARKAP
jgi:hypothetical protein